MIQMFATSGNTTEKVVLRYSNRYAKRCQWPANARKQMKAKEMSTLIALSPSFILSTNFYYYKQNKQKIAL